MSNDLIDNALIAYKQSLRGCKFYDESEYRAAKERGDTGLLVEAALPAVFKMVGEAYGQHGDYDLGDIVQAANMGVMNAAEAWRPEDGSTWIWFAKQKARGYIYNMRRANYLGSCADTFEEIPEEISEEDWIAALQETGEYDPDTFEMPTRRERVSGRSLDNPAHAGEVFGEGAAAEAEASGGPFFDYADRMANPDPMNDPAKVAENDDTMAPYYAKFDELTAKQREVMSLLYREDWTQAEVARHLGVSREAVRRIHDRALTELQKLSI
jgi:RNA polymerase sigma factor (sigma-70 family)